MRRVLVAALIKALIAVPVFLLLSWWNAAVGVLFGIAALAWILAPVYFATGGLYGESSGESESREERHRKFFE